MTANNCIVAGDRSNRTRRFRPQTQWLSCHQCLWHPGSSCLACALNWLGPCDTSERRLSRQCLETLSEVLSCGPRSKGRALLGGHRPLQNQPRPRTNVECRFPISTLHVQLNLHARWSGRMVAILELRLLNSKSTNCAIIHQSCNMTWNGRSRLWWASWAILRHVQRALRLRSDHNCLQRLLSCGTPTTPPDLMPCSHDVRCHRTVVGVPCDGSTLLHRQPQSNFPRRENSQSLV